MNKLLSNKKIFFKIISGDFISSFGNSVANISISWFLLYITSSAQITGIVLFISSMGSLIISPFIGSLIDRYSIKKILFIQIIINVVIILGMLLYNIFNISNIYILSILLFIRGIISPILLIAIRLIYNITFTEDDALEYANSISTVLMYFQSIIAPLLAGFIIEYYTISIIFIINIITYVIFIFIILQVKENFIHSKDDMHNFNILKDIYNGLKYVTKSKLILGLIILMFFLNLTTEPLDLIIPNLIQNELKISATQMGYFFSIMSVGSVLSALLYNYFKYKKKLGLILLICNFCVAISLLLMGLTISYPILLLVLAFIHGFFISPIDIASITLRQRLVPKSQQGKVFSFTMIINKLGAPIGNALAGIFLIYMNTSTLLLLYGMILLIIVLLVKSIEDFKNAEI